MTMRTLIRFTFSAILFLSFFPDCALAQNKFKISRGTNIAHWLSQSESRGVERESYFTAKDVQLIKKSGFDFIRVPVDEEQLWDSSGKRQAEAFALLKNCLNWAQKEKLKVVLDLHIVRSHYFMAREKPLFTQVEAQDKFIALWKDLSSFANKWSNDFLAYELLNEPAAKKDDQWNGIMRRAVDSIRSWEKDRTIVIGSNRWQSVHTFANLRIPEDDKNIILSFHFYEPFLLTHFKAPFTPLKTFEGEVQYPGQIVLNPKGEDQKTVYDRDTLEKIILKAVEVAKRYKLPLNCGEFGVIDLAPEASKIAWYKDIVAIFQKHNISYSNWNYKDSGTFGIVDPKLKPSKLVNILTETQK